MNKRMIDSKVTVIDEDGVLRVMGRVNEQRLHVKYLLNYMNINYPKVNIGTLTEGNVRDRLAYQLGMMGNITYFNDMNFGMLYFPNELTDEQLEALYNIDLGNQKVGICYNLKEVGTNIMFRTIGMGNDYTLKEAVEEYMDRMAVVKHHRR